MDKASAQGQVRSVAVGSLGLDGVLDVPEGSAGIVLFAHGSGSSRSSPRNSMVAASLHRAGLATLLFDLLSEDEARDRGAVFDIPLLAERLVQATSWIRQDSQVGHLPIGYFGASTGAAAALVAAAAGAVPVAAIVSRGGRPDLAGPALARVAAPTLLIVGGADSVVLDLNRRALAELHCEKDLAVVPGASHLFEEPGALARVAELATGWFASHLAGAQ